MFHPPYSVLCLHVSVTVGAEGAEVSVTQGEERRERDGENNRPAGGRERSSMNKRKRGKERDRTLVRVAGGVVENGERRGGGDSG